MFVVAREADAEGDGEQGGDKSGTSIPTTDGKTGSVEGLTSDPEICGDMLRMFLKTPHQQKVNRSFTALPSFWRTFREFFDSRSRLTRKSRQEPGKV